jgi:hypothetical protein
VKKIVLSLAFVVGFMMITETAHADCSATTLESALSTATRVFANSAQSISAKQSAFNTLLTTLNPCTNGEPNYAASPGCTGLFTAVNGYAAAADYAAQLNGWIQALTMSGNFFLGASNLTGQLIVNGYYLYLGGLYVNMGSCSG